MSDEAWIETQGPGLWVPPAPAPLPLPDLFSAMPACAVQNPPFQNHTASLPNSLSSP